MSELLITPREPSNLEMYLPDHKASTRIGNFVNSKHPALSAIIGKPESLYISYRPNEFIALLAHVALDPSVTGLRVYFASYQKIGEPQLGSSDTYDKLYNNSLIPAGLEDTMTLIYATTHDDNGVEFADTGDYFVFDVKGVLTNIKGTGVAERWTAHFFDTKCKVLEDMLNFMSEAPKPKPYLYETQCVLFKRRLIKDYHEFLTAPDSKDLPDSVFAFFGAYHLRDPKEETNYSGKLTLLFGLMKQYKKLFFYYQNKEENNVDKDRAAEDTGVPCPPPGCQGATLSHA